MKRVPKLFHLLWTRDLDELARIAFIMARIADILLGLVAG